MRDNGVAERDLASTGLSIQPQLDWRGTSPQVTGYQVNQTVTARLRDTDRAGAVINAAANSAGNTTIINSIAWDLEDNTALLADARDRAIADARTKAEQYAKAAGRSLGAVVSISEPTTAPPQPYAYGAAEAQDSALARSRSHQAPRPSPLRCRWSTPSTDPPTFRPGGQKLALCRRLSMQRR